MRTDETRRAEMHARRSSMTPQHICPHVAALWRDGYTAHQIATLSRRSLADVRIMTAQLRPPERAEFCSSNLRRAT